MTTTCAHLNRESMTLNESALALVNKLGSGSICQIWGKEKKEGKRQTETATSCWKSKQYPKCDIRNTDLREIRNISNKQTF